MPRRAAAIGAALAALAPAVLSSVAGATAPGHWDAVTAPTGRNIDQVGLLRTPDGKLHAVWQRKHGTNMDLVQTVMAPSGAVGPAQTVASNWVGIGAPAIVRDRAGGLLVLAGAAQSLDSPIQNLAAWRSSDNGASWSLQPTDAAFGAGFADPVGAVIGADGMTPFFAWTTTFGVFIHRGTDAMVPAADFHSHAGFTCCGYDPGMAIDGASGQLVVAWYSNATGHPGVFAQAVEQGGGGPIGAPALMPGSTTRYAGTTESSSTLARTPVVARAGKPGVFVAYPGGYPRTSRVVVWRFGASRSSVLATRSNGVENVGIAATPSGKLWAFWTADGRVYARRSNVAASSWGATTSIPVRKGTVSVYKLVGNAQDGVLDLIASFGRIDSGVQAWHSQIHAGLTVAATPASVKTGAKKAAKVTVKVTDAGDPVKGVTVKLGSRTRTTGAGGTATFSVGPFARPATLVARASKAGYAGASAAVHVRR